MRNIVAPVRMGLSTRDKGMSRGSLTVEELPQQLARFRFAVVIDKRIEKQNYHPPSIARWRQLSEAFFRIIAFVQLLFSIFD